MSLKSMRLSIQYCVLISNKYFLSIRQGLLDMVILLMRHGADPSLEDNEGKV